MNIDKFEFVLKRDKRKRHKGDKYFSNGVFSASRGIFILLGNSWYNTKIESHNEEWENDKEFLEYVIIEKIKGAILHEYFHKIMYKYIRFDCDISKLQNGIESDLIDRAIEYVIDEVEEWT